MPPTLRLSEAVKSSPVPHPKALRAESYFRSLAEQAAHTLARKARPRQPPRTGKRMARQATSRRLGEQGEDRAVRHLFKTCRVLQRYCPALVLTFLIVCSILASKAAPLRDDPYAPRRFGIPDTIGGYTVFAVLTEQNYACMKAGEKRLLLQSQNPNIESALRSFPGKRSALAKWESSLVGPGQTREELISRLEKIHLYLKAYGCAPLDIPTMGLCNQTTGECKQNHPPGGYAGFAVIQNTSQDLTPPNMMPPYPVTAQSVMLVAPIVGRQGGFGQTASKKLSPGTMSNVSTLHGLAAKTMPGIATSSIMEKRRQVTLCKWGFISRIKSSAILMMILL